MSTFRKTIESIAGSYRLSEVFSDFMQMAVCCFAMGRMEEQYLKVASRYKPEELSEFAKALAFMIKEYEAISCKDGSWGDLLGQTFEELNSSQQASNSGQFFTPVSICDLMAKMTEGEGTTVSDPSCGSGRNLIAHSRLSPNRRLQTFYTGNDLDAQCVNMTVINMVMYGMKGVVIHMNTLSLEIFKGYRIYLPEVGLGVQPLSVEQCHQFVFGSKPEDEPAATSEIDTKPEVPKPTKLITPVQLDLFGAA